MKQGGKWTRTMPGGDAVFVYYRKGLSEYIEHVQKLVDEAAQNGTPAPPEARTFPRVAQRIGLPDGTHRWLVAGSERFWTDEELLGRCVFWSKPINVPRITFLLAKEIHDQPE